MKRKGFTVTELIICLGIVTMILAVGIPYFLTSRANQNLNIGARELKHNVEYLRSIARKQGTPETGEVAPYIVFDAPISHSPGYTLKDKTNTSIRRVLFSGGVYAICSDFSGTVSFTPGGATNISGNIIVKNDNTRRTLKLKIISGTGTVITEQ